jgi:hypothetical protein
MSRNNNEYEFAFPRRGDVGTFHMCRFHGYELCIRCLVTAHVEGSHTKFLNKSLQKTLLPTSTVILLIFLWMQNSTSNLR